MLNVTRIISLQGAEFIDYIRADSICQDSVTNYCKIGYVEYKPRVNTL